MTIYPRKDLRLAFAALLIFCGTLYWHQYATPFTKERPSDPPTPPSIAPPDVKDVYLNEKGIAPAARTTVFNTTHLFLRLHQYLPERILHASVYDPYFGSITLSMPALGRNDGRLFESSENGDLLYESVAATVQSLSVSDTVSGLLFNHFDVWFNPNKFSHMNMTLPWLIKSTTKDNLKTAHVDKAETVFGGWMYSELTGSHHRRAHAAQREIAARYPGRFHLAAHCISGGWADLYYIPREYFDDFIVLAGVFLKHEVHHETAVPAIMLILASSRHPELLAALAKDECPSPSIFTSHGSLSLIDDCWGHCCSYGIAADEIAKYRCGHHLDLHSIDHVKAFIKTI